MLKVSSHQPAFMPWVGYWHKVLSADAHVVSTGVEFTTNDFQHRVKLNDVMMTLPLVSKKGLVSEIVVKDLENVISRISREVLVKKSKYAYRLDGLMKVLQKYRQGGLLLDICMETFTELGACLGMQAKVSMTSDLEESYGKAERLRKRLEALYPEFVYLAGQGAAKGYLSAGDFGHDVLVQVRTTDHVYPNSVLQLIAQAEKPSDLVLSAFRWEPLCAS